MNDIERIAKALKKDEKLREGAMAALDVLNSAISGKTEKINAKYQSWTELDTAYRGVLSGHVKSTALRQLLEIMISAAVGTFSKGR